MAHSTKVSKTGVWLLLGVLGLAGAQNAACSAPFHSCHELRRCPKETQAEAGAAGDESAGASAESGQPAGGAAGAGRGGTKGGASGAADPSSGDAGDGGDAGGTVGTGGTAGTGGTGPLSCAADQYSNGTSCQKLTVCATGEFQKTAPTSASDRVCAPWTVCVPGTSVSTQPTTTVDRACSPCAAGKFSNAANATQCTAWTQCGTGETESVAPSLTSDRVCSKCGTGKYESGGQCLSLTACTSAQYESTAATATSDRKCSALTACSTAQYRIDGSDGHFRQKVHGVDDLPPGSGQTAAPTATSDRKCAACIAGQFSTQVNSTCKAWTVCTATQNQSMAGTATTDVVCVEKPGFLGGPCVANTGGTGVEVFARGDDKKIYRRAVDGNALGSWAVLAGLDGTAIDNRSDLDCAGGTTDINIVAVGNNPHGRAPACLRVRHDATAPSPGHWLRRSSCQVCPSPRSRRGVITG